jgi:hypothetical protein
MHAEAAECRVARNSHPGSCLLTNMGTAPSASGGVLSSMLAANLTLFLARPASQPPWLRSRLVLAPGASAAACRSCSHALSQVCLPASLALSTAPDDDDDGGSNSDGTRPFPEAYAPLSEGCIGGLEGRPAGRIDARGTARGESAGMARGESAGMARGDGGTGLKMCCMLGAWPRRGGGTAGATATTRVSAATTDSLSRASSMRVHMY